jgi:LysM domain
MRVRQLLAALLLLAILAACVPEPAYRLSASATAQGGGAGAATPEPTPAGPTPTPSFVRPTPTPGPTFTSYKVKRGDTLTSIAKKFDTSAKSISYWNRATYPSLDPDSAHYRPDRLEVDWILVLLPHQEVDPEDLPPLAPEPTDTPEPTT